MTTSFADLGLADALVSALHRRHIAEPFPIQTEAIPPGLEGRDIQGQAPTGSGKTLAFGLPLLSRVGAATPRRPRALVLAPTRELADQISRDLIPLAAAIDRTVFAVYGGVGYGHQKRAIQQGADVLVATPGRLEDLIDQRLVDLAGVDIVVVDEADRMADMGFLPAVRRILDQTDPARQTFLFSATMDGDVAVLSRRYQKDPVVVEAVATKERFVEAIHHFWKVNRDDRVEHTARLILDRGRSIVFTRTRHGADRLVKQLTRADVSAVSIHGGRSQSQRARALRAFSNGGAQALVATDVAARGIHVDDVEAVIHFDPAADHKDYLHRSGRTARAGAAGSVVTMVMSDQERAVRTMQRQLNFEVPIVNPQLGRLHDAGRNTDDPSGSSSPPRSLRGKVRGSGRPSQGATGLATRSIYVGNLPWGSTEHDLVKLFADHGNVESATVIRQANSGRSKGFGFVYMSEKHGASAIEALTGAQIGGRRLRIHFAK